MKNVNQEVLEMLLADYLCQRIVLVFVLVQIILFFYVTTYYSLFVCPFHHIILLYLQYLKIRSKGCKTLRNAIL